MRWPTAAVIVFVGADADARAQIGPETKVVELDGTLAGHINEAGDLFAEGGRLPEVREGDVRRPPSTSSGYAEASQLEANAAIAAQVRGKPWNESRPSI
jgi:hypothetical protein